MAPFALREGGEGGRQHLSCGHKCLRTRLACGTEHEIQHCKTHEQRVQWRAQATLQLQQASWTRSGTAAASTSTCSTRQRHEQARTDIDFMTALLHAL
jgi:hypothetical protein